MSWVPTTDFEEEIVDLQPDHDFIYGRLSEPAAQTFYPRPKEHLDFVQQQKKEKHLREKNCTNSQNHKLNLIAKVQRIAGTKPLGEQPTIEDWDSNENVVRETVALMRHVGFNPSVEESLDEARTIATHPITEEVKINRNGRKHMPIFFSEKFFELKPRAMSPPSSPTISPNKSTEMDENYHGGFDESITSERSSVDSHGSNNKSQRSSIGAQSKKSYSEFKGKSDFNDTIQSGNTQKSGRTSKSGKRVSLSNSNSSSPSSSSNISRGSSSAMSNDTYKDRSSNTGNSGFESAKDEDGDEDSFETAQNSVHGSRSQIWPKNGGKESGQSWRSMDKAIETKSWRHSNLQGQSTNGNNYHIQSNWRSPTEYRRKDEKVLKNNIQLCSPKQLYAKKRQSVQK